MKSTGVTVKLAVPVRVRLGGDDAGVTVSRYSRVTSAPVNVLVSTGRSNVTWKLVSLGVPSAVNEVAAMGPMSPEMMRGPAAMVTVGMKMLATDGFRVVSGAVFRLLEKAA